MLWWCGVVVCSVEENIQHSEIYETSESLDGPTHSQCLPLPLT